MTYEPRLHVVLHQPEIPQNTGNVGRTCVAAGAKLWLVPTDDWDGSCFSSWNPNDYLFETELIYEEPYEYTLLNLYEKDGDPDWNIVEDEAQGKMHHGADDFEFWGEGLSIGIQYTLIYYKDPWNGATTSVNQCLSDGTADGDGNIHLLGSYDFSLIPESGDANAGAKIWLVLSDDVDCPTGGLSAWNPTEYLFENNLIN